MCAKFQKICLLEFSRNSNTRLFPESQIEGPR